jgi:hypothetical protein
MHTGIGDVQDRCYPVIDDLTDAQKRVLRFMGPYGSRLFSLLELENIRLLQDDDVVVVPSLIEKGLVKCVGGRSVVALTPSGVVIANELLGV